MTLSFWYKEVWTYQLTAPLKGCFVNDGQSNFDIGQLFSNLNSKEMGSVEKFICTNAVVTDENSKKFLLQNSNEAEVSFNDHRDQYLQFIFEGLKFHFLVFLPSGVASKINTLDLDKLVALAM